MKALKHNNHSPGSNCNRITIILKKNLRKIIQGAAKKLGGFEKCTETKYDIYFNTIKTPDSEFHLTDPQVSQYQDIQSLLNSTE